MNLSLHFLLPTIQKTLERERERERRRRRRKVENLEVIFKRGNLLL
jgi:hypothetical protein